MAKNILSVAPKATLNTPQYHLPAAARQAILAQASSAHTCAEIERQRIVFISNNFGCAFGQNIQATHLK